MDKEGFLDAIRKQYTDEIRAAYLQSEHGKSIDYVQLHHALTRLMKTAKIQGLGTRDFMDLAKGELGETWSQIEPTWFKVA